MGQTVQIFRTEKEWFLNITLGILKYFCHIASSFLSALFSQIRQMTLKTLGKFAIKMIFEHVLN